ncbi:MAG: hypothetical protein AAF333_00985 [Planctomycetota bacterium]
MKSRIRWKLFGCGAVVIAVGTIAGPAAGGDVLFHQSFTNNADGKVNAAGADYGLFHFRGPEAADRSGAKTIRPEKSKPAGPAENVNAKPPHRNDALPDAGMVRIGVKPGDQVLLYTVFDRAVNIGSGSDVTWDMVFGSSKSPVIQRGGQWYVLKTGQAVKGGQSILSTAITGPGVMWRKLDFVPDRVLTIESTAIPGSEIEGQLTAAGFFSVNNTETTQTIRTDNWQLSGGGATLGGAVEPAEEPSSTPPALGPLPHGVRVGPTDRYTTFGIYGASPESPDGTRVLYTALKRTELSEYDDLARGALWLCDPDGTNHRKLRDIEYPVRVHNGVFQQWGDHDSIAYSGGHHFAGDVYVINADTGETEGARLPTLWPAITTTTATS